MSSFKRKTGTKAEVPVGTRPSPSSPSAFLTSTGIPSLDDILGGGVPLSCSALILAPDLHSAYGDLVHNYFLAQGLAVGHNIVLVDEEPLRVFDECMWTPTSFVAEQDRKELEADQHEEKIKIAWRYETMKQFRTTVESNQSSEDEYCRTFDLTCHVPRGIVDQVLESGQLSPINLADGFGSERTQVRLIAGRIAAILQASHRPTRVCISSLGSPSWGDLGPQDVLFLLVTLRGLLRKYPLNCAMICLSPSVATDAWGGPGWTQKLGWAVDACITVKAFTANPSLLALFPTHHGLVQISALPVSHSVLAPSDKLSTLRGLSSSPPGTGGGENNLAFKCMRKRMIFETLHLDLEGGVGERRTTPGSNSWASAINDGDQKEGDKEEPVVKIHLGEGGSGSGSVAPRKKKKAVGFASERPDISYEF